MTANKAVSNSNSADLNGRNKYVDLLPAVLFGFILLWFMSALIHLADPDISGIHEFAKISILFSVTFWMVLVFVLPALIIIGAQIMGKTKGYITSLLFVSVGLTILLEIASKGAVGYSALLMQSGIVLLVFSFVTYPIVQILNHRKFFN